MVSMIVGIGSNQRLLNWYLTTTYDIGYPSTKSLFLLSFNISYFYYCLFYKMKYYSCLFPIFFSICNLGIWSKWRLRIHNGNKCIGSAIFTTTASKRFYIIWPCNKKYKTTIREYLYCIFNCRKNNCSPTSQYLSIYTKTRIGF